MLFLGLVGGWWLNEFLFNNNGNSFLDEEEDFVGLIVSS